MPRTYNESTVVCPFFRTTATSSISCEGITDDCTVKLQFCNGKKRDAHRKIYCERNYKYCEIYRVLEKKYE